MKIKNSIREKQFMIIAILILTFPLFLVSCTPKQELPTEDEAAAAIMEKIKAANDRWASGDPTGFLDCAAPDITWMDDLGATYPVQGYDSLKTYLESFKGQIPPHQHELQVPMFQNYGDMVIVTYRYQATFDGEVQAPWKVTSVYRYKDGDWLSVHENWTEVK
jgi:ketosteroid isomerase-like protein